MVEDTYRLTLVNLYPSDTLARYLLSSYLLKAYLAKSPAGTAGLSVEVLNFNEKAEVPHIIENRPDCVGYSCYTWNIKKIFDVIRTLKGRINVTHVLGGPEISLNMIKSLPTPPPGDYYVVGEGEKKFAGLVSYLRNTDKNPGADLPAGIAHWENGRLDYRENNEVITNLDEIPSIYLTGAIDDSLYTRQQALLETQRGCRYRCRYCVYHKNLSSISYYSEKRVYEELEHLIVEKQVMALRILDAVFTSDLPRAKRITQFLPELKNRGVRLPWIYWEFSYRDVDEEFMSLMASLKYRERILNTEEVPPLDRPQLYSDLLKDYTVINSIGVESFYGQSLKAVGRPGINPEKFDAFMKMAREYNIVLKVDLILGLPYETFDSYFRGLESFIPYFKDNDHILNIHLLSILPGSDLEDLCEKYDIKYSPEAPRLISSTNGFSEEELKRALKLSAVLFRALNSPLRKQFFDLKEHAGGSFLELLERILKAICASPALAKTRLVRGDNVDDDYWNGDIFREIPSQWLIDFFEKETRP
jgi:radical SAM superfamily enzyme YgiQ (UPF0313 family)